MMSVMSIFGSVEKRGAVCFFPKSFSKDTLPELVRSRKYVFDVLSYPIKIFSPTSFERVITKGSSLE